MKIAIIGTGNIGATLAAALVKAGHDICFGVRDEAGSFKGRDTALRLGIPFMTIPAAVENSDVIILAVPALATVAVATSLGDVSGKVIIDTANTVSAKLEGYTNTSDAILANCNCADVVKCFNSTGYENLANPVYNGEAIDMFMAGSSAKGKTIARRLSGELGFANCYDFGGNDRFAALEQFAFAWINLAIMQKNGRNIAFKLVKR